MELGDLQRTSLYSKDLAPAGPAERTWGTWDFAAIWVGMAASIPTYILASYMLRDGLGASEAISIIVLANLIVTIPMVLNGHAGVKYGLPFAVIGRAPFGILGVHIPALARALIACGWFGIQTWIGGLAIHAICCALAGTPIDPSLTAGKFLSFAASWCLTLFFVWRGTESIRHLERLAAPALLLVGVVLVAWGLSQGGSFALVLKQAGQLERATAVFTADNTLSLSPLRNEDGRVKADAYRIGHEASVEHGDWHPLSQHQKQFEAPPEEPLFVQFRRGETLASPVQVQSQAEPEARGKRWFFWLTAMVGFWATMSISIADITRYGRSQRTQAAGQFIGLPTTMLLYSFVSVFVTSAALIGFEDLLVAEDAPWDPVALVSRFDMPLVVILAQAVLFLATLTTNIAANVIAPANVFANLLPGAVSFRLGGLITGIAGVAIAPWLLLDRISELLVFVSGFLGPVLGVMLADYYLLRRTRLSVKDLFDPQGCYAYAHGFNLAALIALACGLLVALSGYFVPSMSWLYTGSWFSGGFIAFLVYGALMTTHTERGNVPSHS